MFSPKKTKKIQYNIFSFNKYSKVRGFSLIETLVATAILLISIVGPLTLVHKALSTIKISKERVIASYLTQDAVEYIRNKRDENILAGDAWLNGMENCKSSDGSKKCTVDTVGGSSPDFKTCGASGCENLKYNPDTGLYSYNNSYDSSGFNRSVALKEINSDEISVIVTMSWGSGVFSRDFVAKDNLLNWF